jgi:hypothetical protein
MSLFVGLWLAGLGFAATKERVVESVLPSLEYGPQCSSSVDLQNLGDRSVTLEVEAHRASGALVALVDHPRLSMTLPAGERASFRLEINEETGSAWAKVRGRVPSTVPSPVVAVVGHTECVFQNELRRSAREVAFALRNPSFSSDELHGRLVSMVNTSERASEVSLC